MNKFYLLYLLITYDVKRPVVLMEVKPLWIFLFFQVFIEFAKVQEEIDEVDEADRNTNTTVQYDRSLSVRSLPRPQNETNGEVQC